MSYDTSLSLPQCEHCGHQATFIDLGNITSNVGTMYYLALPGPYPGGGRYDGTGDPEWGRGGLPGLSGLTAETALPHLRQGIVAMESEPETYKALAPANGWGDYAGALIYLHKIRAACIQYPKATLCVNW